MSAPNSVVEKIQLIPRKSNAHLAVTAILLSAFSCGTNADTLWEQTIALKDCLLLLNAGFRPLAEERNKRFLGKVNSETANCRGGSKALRYRDTPWVDWQNYWATGDTDSRASPGISITELGRHFRADGRGIDGALTDLEYQRIELIKFNLFDNQTYPDYIKGRDGVDGRALKTWPQLRLPPEHPHYQAVGGAGPQACKGQLIRHRNLTGICNDIENPLMGAAKQPFARNVPFEATFPDLSANQLVRNRHADRIGLMKPDPQLVSRRLFTRAQREPAKCNEGYGLPGNAVEASCDYKSAPFFNVLAAFWIQFMTHDWFSHLREGHNADGRINVGCKTQRVDNEERPLTGDEIRQLKCRPDDQVDPSYYAEITRPPTFRYGGKTYLSRAHKTTANTVTAWWDASQIYGYDDISQQRVKRDPNDRAKLFLVPHKDPHSYLPPLTICNKDAKDCVTDPGNPDWAGQESVAFPDNWNIGLSFFHNVFAREQNVFVDEFRKRAAQTPDADSGLRNPDRPDEIIRYQDVSADELFEIARLVISAEIAKIHTLEWTTQLLYTEPLYLAMKANWFGLLGKHDLVADALKRVVSKLGESTDPNRMTSWYSVFASGPGIFGLGNRVFAGDFSNKDIWDLSNPGHVNGGTNHFGSPFNFPEEFTTVYRLHPMMPDLIEYREFDKANMIKYKIPVVETFRGKATGQMRKHGLANWAVSLGRQRIGALSLSNHPQFLQNLPMPRLNTATNKLDVAALDLLRDRERGVPRFNEFRRQYGLKTLTGFDDFVDKRLPAESPLRREQENLAELMREIYGQHRCDASKVITDAQLNDDGSPINDCLGHPDRRLVDNIEDLDTVVGWLAEPVRPHGFAISETQFQVFILNASRRLFSDRFFTSSFRPEFYSNFGIAWVNNNGPDGKRTEQGEPNGHLQEVSPLKRVLLRTIPELSQQLARVLNAFDPWDRDRGDYYSLD